MSGTPIFDELYAKYVAGAAAASGAVATCPAPPAGAEQPRQDQPAAQYTGRHQTLVWPS
ncbi:hypothetical protein [Nocardia sp. NRRL S-836]|uniref:hypothetical protein n=1 Tax=Nocardia sp. NRRL S-836 TaxID=1519492 RepID=UPI000AE3AAF3|nr:hypothetical protein [Nocardia sp. NRRL S-836]